MKKIYPIVFLMAVLSGLQACSDGDDPDSLTGRLQLEGAIGASTRAVLNSGYEADLAVCFARCDAGESAWQELPAVRIGGAGSTPVVFDVPQFYPEGGKSVQLHGYYPRSGWAGGAGGAPVYTVADGETDLMATGVLNGSYPDAQITGCTFRHLLTQLKFVCFSDQPDLWGAVTQIEVEGIYRQQTFRLTDTNPTLSPVTTSGVATLGAIGTADGRTFDLYDTSDGLLPAARAVQDSILIPAQGAGTAGHPLVLHVTTQKSGVGVEKPGGYLHTATLVVKEADGAGGVQPGYSHRVEIAFTSSGLEVVGVSVEPWSSVEIKDPIPL